MNEFRNCIGGADDPVADEVAAAWHSWDLEENYVYFLPLYLVIFINSLAYFYSLALLILHVQCTANGVDGNKR